jgi:hypothetical protein
MLGAVHLVTAHLLPLISRAGRAYSSAQNSIYCSKRSKRFKSNSQLQRSRSSTWRTCRGSQMSQSQRRNPHTQAQLRHHETPVTRCFYTSSVPRTAAFAYLGTIYPTPLRIAAVLALAHQWPNPHWSGLRIYLGPLGLSSRALISGNWLTGTHCSARRR